MVRRLVVGVFVFIFSWEVLLTQGRIGASSVSRMEMAMIAAETSSASAAEMHEQLLVQKSSDPASAISALPREEEAKVKEDYSRLPKPRPSDAERVSSTDIDDLADEDGQQTPSSESQAQAAVARSEETGRMDNVAHYIDAAGNEREGQAVEGLPPSRRPTEEEAPTPADEAVEAQADRFPESLAPTLTARIAQILAGGFMGSVVICEFQASCLSWLDKELPMT